VIVTNAAAGEPELHEQIGGTRRAGMNHYPSPPGITEQAVDGFTHSTRSARSAGGSAAEPLALITELPQISLRVRKIITLTVAWRVFG
jgi:hypothetical protein